MGNRGTFSAACVVVLVLMSWPTVWAQTGSATQAVGLTLQALSEEDLNTIQSSSGYRVGVVVVAVAPGSAAAAADLRAKDILLTVAARGVDSPQAVEAALTSATGTAQILAMRAGEDGKWQPVTINLALGATTTAPTPFPATPATPTVPTPTAPATGGDVNAKLRALDTALQAGVITQEEYDRKRAELQPQGGPTPTMDAAARQKLAALDAALAAGILDQQEYARKRAEILGGAPTTPLTTPAPPPTTAAAQTPQAAPATHTGQLYNHPMGFRFWYPTGWKVQTQEEGLQLVPPDQATTASGPAEYYALTAVSVAGEGIASADDPRVLQFIEEQVRQFIPTLTRSGEALRLALDNGRAVCADWTAQNAQGQPVKARVYATVLRDFGVALFALGIKDRLESRDAELRRVFSSISLEAGKVDPQLVGQWAFRSTYALSNDMGERVGYYDSYSKAKMVSESQRTMELLADGGVTRTTKREMLAGAAGIWIEDKSTNTERGRWNAAEGHLYLTWEDGDVEHFRYQLQAGAGGRELRLESGGNGEVWSQ